MKEFTYSTHNYRGTSYCTVMDKRGKRLGCLTRNVKMYGEGWVFRITVFGVLHGIGKNLTRSAAAEEMMKLKNRAKRSAESRKASKVCVCREPKRHRDCFYCGIGFSDRICGVCKEAGIDGKAIAGTSRVICKIHKPVAGH